VSEEVDYCPFDGSPLRESRPLPTSADVVDLGIPSPAATTPGSDPFIGYELLGRYLLLERIGQGGFATVYRAQRIGQSGSVAIKLVTQSRRGDETIARRFEREGQILNAFSHPNAVGIVECGVTGEGLAYIVMEYVEGQTLRWIIANESPLALPRIEAVLLQVGAAITAAHRKGIIHRDLKPENVVIVQTSAGEVAKVLDFGVASLRSADVVDGQITGNDLVVGTPRYLAPEALIEGVQTAASDVYTLGIVAYEMLTGRAPFEPTVGENSLEVAVRLARQQPPPPSSFNPQLSAEIDDVILRCISREPGDRFATPTEFAEAIAAAITDVLSNSPETDPLSRSMPALRPDQYDAIEETIKGVPAISDEMLAGASISVDKTVVGMPSLPPSAPLPAAPATVVGMPALPPSAPLPAVPATVVGMPALPPSGPLPAAAETVVGMPALPPSGPLPAAAETVVGMPALPPSGPLPAAAETVVGMPALPPSRPLPAGAATVVGMPALPPSRPLPAAAATVVGMPALPQSGTLPAASETVAGIPADKSAPLRSEQAPSVASGRESRAQAGPARSFNPVAIIAVLVVLAVVLAAILLLK